jgi:hypothetical protein
VPHNLGGIKAETTPIARHWKKPINGFCHIYASFKLVNLSVEFDKEILTNTGATGKNSLLFLNFNALYLENEPL